MAQQYVDFTWVKSEANFAAVLSHYGIKFPPGRDQFKVSCPFHSEAEPSLSVNVPEKKFKCFGCNAQGSILDFVVGIEGSNLRQAAIKLAEICGCGLAPPKGGAENRGRRKAEEAPSSAEMAKRTGEEEVRTSAAPVQPASGLRSKPPAEEHREAVSAASAPSSDSQRRQDPKKTGVNPTLEVKLTLDPKHPYLAERGLTKETIAEFGLGYCGRGLMRGRIAIPIHDADGNLVAYAGRWPGDSGWPKGEGKYKLPRGFEKSGVLFNLHRAKEGKPGEVILVEGFFSVFRLWQARATYDAVPLMGRELSEAQENLLDEEFLRITLLLDNDAPGREATAALLARLSRRFFVRVPALPEGKSPDNLNDEELEALRNYL